MGEIRVDEAREGCLLITYVGQVPELEYRAYLDAISTRLSFGNTFAAIVDARLSEMNSPPYLRQQASWLKENRARLEDLRFGTVMILDQPALRFALSALLSIAPMPGTYRVAATLDEATDWAEQHVATQRRRVATGLYS